METKKRICNYLKVLLKRKAKSCIHNFYSIMQKTSVYYFTLVADVQPFRAGENHNRVAWVATL